MCAGRGDAWENATRTGGQATAAVLEDLHRLTEATQDPGRGGGRLWTQQVDAAADEVPDADIVALALNSLPPRYVADKYYKFPDDPARAERSKDTAIRAVRMAVRKVSRRPHHDRDQ